MNRRRFLTIGGGFGVAAVLVACGSDQPDDHRFANEQIPTESLTTGGLTPAKGSSKPTATSTATMSLADLLQVKGKLTGIGLSDAQSFWSIRSDGSGAARFGDIPKGSSAEIVVSLDGARIGAMVTRPDGEENISIRDQNGLELRRFTVPAKEGTPAAALAPSSIRGRLAWSPAGDQLLFAKSRGGIDALSEKGDPRTIVSVSQAPVPGAISWSNKGDTIAFASRSGPAKSDGLYAGATNSIPIDAARIVAPSASPVQAIPALVWLPDDSMILYTQRIQDANDALRGDMFQVSPASGSSTVFITSGIASPVSAIDLFAISPGGEAIAFTVLAPNGAGIAFHSLWIQQLTGGIATRIDIGSTAAVTGLWWTDRGLVWRDQPGSVDPSDLNGDFQLRRATADGQGETIFSSKDAHLATPVASPVASPVKGSPIAGSPVATSPVASPTAIG